MNRTLRTLTAPSILLLALGLEARASNPESAPGVSAASQGPAEKFSAGLAAVASGNLPAGVALLEAAVQAAPNNLRYGAEYRQAILQTAEYDRSVALFEKITGEHPELPYAWMNLGYAYVDKIPSAGAITQVILANTALGHFSKAIELDGNWLALYTRGNSYLYWPKIFGRTALGMADLERATALARQRPRRSYQALAWVALGDGYWRLDELDKARNAWREGLELYPGDERLAGRLSLGDTELAAFMDEHFATSTRVGTDLRELWHAGWEEACPCDPNGN